MMFQDFIASDAARQHYWGRAVIGWNRFKAAAPGAAHRALARLESQGRLQRLLTQNVDGLHQQAGSVAVTDLHGRLDTVVCLNCAGRWPREQAQHWLSALNPGWLDQRAEARPDGDVELERDFSSFQLAPCPRCGGALKPNVVFFGESVPRERVEQAYAAVAAADRLLVVGSSLMVYSGYRFIVAARERGIPIAIVNVGRTRGDDDAHLKIQADCGETLSQLALRLQGGSGEQGLTPA